MLHHYELAKGDVKLRGTLIRDNNLSNEIEINRLLKTELYHSIWLYDESITLHMMQYKTIRSFKGKRALPVIIFDIDKKEDSDDFVLQRAREFVSRLLEDFRLDREELEYYYSGRGYHFHMADYFRFEESFVLPIEVKNTFNYLFPEIDSSPYQSAGLIRAPYSLNKKTGRFKIPLTYDEFTTLKAEDIIQLASDNEIRPVPRMIPDVEANWHDKIIQSPIERDKIAHRDEPTRIVTCMQHLLNKGATIGERHDEMLRLVSAWRRMGQTKGACIVLGKHWAPSLSPVEVSKIVDNVFTQGYRYSCHDKIMVKYCDPKCIHFVNKNYNASVQSGEDVRSILVNDANFKRRHKYIDIGKILKLPLPYIVYMGDLVVIWGDTKIGKSTLAQNIVALTEDINWLYLPLENGIALDSRRFIQIRTGKPKEEIVDIMDRGSYEEQMSLIDTIQDIKFSEAGMDIVNMKKSIAENDIDAIVIDTIDQMLPDKDYNDAIRTLTVQLRDLTRTMKKAVFVVHHISKHAAQNEEGMSRPLTIHSGIGSSALEHKADKVIGIEGDRNKPIRKVSSLGARDEDTFSTQLYFDKNNFRLKTMNGKENGTGLF